MHVIVLSAGEVGGSIAQYLVKEGHSVVVIDESAERLEHLADSLDVQTLQGRGSRPGVLQQAGAESADMLIAVTDSDEINMVACQMAYSLFQVPKKIARVRDSSYLSLTGSHLYTPANLPVDVIISPELEVAQAIARIMVVPGAFDVHTFAQDKLRLVACKVGANAPIMGAKLSAWKKWLVPFSALCILRYGRVLVPQAEDHLEAGDELYFLVKPEDMEPSLALLGKVEPPLKNAFVIGGGNVGYNLCRMLESKGISVRVLERDPQRAELLAELLTSSTVLSGDALNRALLQQENVGQMDAVLCVTSDDAANLLTSLLVRERGVSNVLTLLHQANFLPLAGSVGLDKVVSPRQITVSRILQHVRRGHVVDVHTVGDGMGEVLELQVSPSSELIGSSLQTLQMPRGASIGALIKDNGEILFPWQDKATLQPKSRVVVFARGSAIRAVERLFVEV